MLAALASALALTGPSLGIEAPGDGCTHAGFDAVTWVVGDWAVTHPDSILAHGEVAIQPVWGACALAEQQGGIAQSQGPLGEGLGLLKFNPATGLWVYSFAGDGVTMSAQGTHSEAYGFQLEGTLYFVSDGHSRPATVSWQRFADGQVLHAISMLDRNNGDYVPWQSVMLRPNDTTPRPRTPAHWRDEEGR